MWVSLKQSINVLVLVLAASSLSKNIARADVALGGCLQFQESLQLSPELTMDYVVNLADSQDTSDFPQGVLSAKVTYEGLGWVSVGFTSGPAAMVPGEAIIGLPDEPQGINNPGKYTMSSRTLQGVVLLPESQQTLMNASIAQTDSTTTLTFQKLLVEPDELAIDGNGRTTFLWAHGFGNSLSVHKGRGAVALTLLPCNMEGYQSGATGEADVFETPGRYQGLWAAHGVLAGLAWGVMVPLAISSAFLRGLIQDPLWFKIHMFLNLGAAFFTLVAFSLSVVATQKGTVKGESPNHFAGLAHKTVGLVIMIIVILQVFAGWNRPHAPQKVASDEEVGSKTEASTKTRLRRAWEVAHKLFGFGLLGTALWQVQDGLSLYAQRFGTTDLSLVLWIVFGVIAAATLMLYGYSKCTTRIEEPTEHVGDTEHMKANASEFFASRDLGRH